MNGATPPENTDVSWYTSDAPVYRTLASKSSERYAAIGPYIESCPTFIASTRASATKPGPRSINQKNGNTMNSEKPTPKRYTGLRPMRSERSDQSGMAMSPRSDASITPRSMTDRG